MTQQWASLLWKWLQPRTKALHLFVGFPIVPVTGNKLATLQHLQSSNIVAATSEWTPDLQRVLQALDCEILDTSGRFVLPQLPEFVHAGSGPGILNCLTTALRIAPSQDSDRTHSAKGALSNSRSSVLKSTTCLQQPDASRVESLATADKVLLRRLLLQERWFAIQAQKDRGLTSAALQLLKQLPIYESAAAPMLSADSEQSPVQAESSADSNSQAMFVNLSCTCYIAPPDIHPAVLDHSFIKAEGDGARKVLTKVLGVVNLTSAAIYKQFILPQLSSYPPAVRNAAMLQMLHNLPTLLQQDKGMQVVLQDTAFVPNGQGALQVRKYF